jgi:nucleoside-diphosphate-sugar epimerase
MRARVLVTGATGFVGSVLCDVLSNSGFVVRAALRSDREVPVGVAEKAIVGDIGSRTEWSAALEGVSHVIHTAARVHVMHDSAANTELYLDTNARGTAQLAAAAERAGVERLVYLSSIKVNGEETSSRSYTAGDKPMPLDAYGQSKWQAEQLLHDVAARGKLRCAIVRPPLVYGPGVRANFLRLMRWVDKQAPLPLGAVHNRRSLVSVWNLCDLLLRLLQAPLAGNSTWLISDGEDLSTPELIRRIAGAMNKKARLPPVPVGLLTLAGGLCGKGAEVRRLCGSLSVDIAPTRRDLAWTPPLSVDESLARTVQWYLRERR